MNINYANKKSRLNAIIFNYLPTFAAPNSSLVDIIELGVAPF